MEDPFSLRYTPSLPSPFLSVFFLANTDFPSSFLFSFLLFLLPFSPSPSPYICKQQEKQWYIPAAPYLLSVEDPVEPNNDLGRKCFNILAVKKVFADTYTVLIDSLQQTSHPVNTLLGQVIHGTPFLLSRSQHVPPPE